MAWTMASMARTTGSGRSDTSMCSIENLLEGENRVPPRSGYPTETLRFEVDDPLLDENVCDLVLHFRRVARTAPDALQERGGNFFKLIFPE